ncbi:glycoside hydrolase family 3 C-terminal domain-containing protein [Streptomyces sp. ISL-36]|uniref:glycoside hydrolase family 3 C-terminal domain-containing protein n=1 Tax=Streptomyces sp. ISL-36 TaxID=2819182 RepID=UPI001BE88C80|nr:glycoside hydrolase family 3 C-terminal domain-containing protein [Streptomyces sp. ISL-36]MBT2440166.1 glycoside hydrolase family 3 C-terminal domain-containing protein [Streptomyces sp. ISL-36]
MTQQAPYVPSAYVPSPLAPASGRGLTLPQKASLTSGAGDFVTESVGDVPALSLSDGPHGLRLPQENGAGVQVDLHSAAPATCFPPAVALGSSWDPELTRRVAAAIAAEARAHGVHVVLGPGINIKRSPLCGRNFEYFSEDPFLTAELGGAMVRGLQEAGVAAALKHYAANNQETDRMRVSADIDERPLREIYLRAFERIVRRDRPWSVMAAYNALNGVPLSENRRLLTDVLRTEWGFDGVVMSDWGAVRDRVAALRAGLDLQMPSTGGRTDREVVAAVESGELDMGVLDRSVERLALLARRVTAGAGVTGVAGATAGTVKETVGEASAGSVTETVGKATARTVAETVGEATARTVAEAVSEPVSEPVGTTVRASVTAPPPAPVSYDEHHRLARAAAERCVVLLKNDTDLLPLDPATGSIAVIGELARTPRFQGAGSSQVTPTRLDTALESLREAAVGARVEFAAGYALPDGAGNTAAGDDLAAEAEQLAARSDTVLLFLGLPAQDESEGFDRDHIDLPEVQILLLERILAVNPRVAVVLSNGGVVRTAPWHARVPSLVEGWLLGQAGGAALARILFGAVAPSGRLAETIPLRLEDSPSHLSFPGEEGHVRYGEGVFVGYRGHDARGDEVAFPFGHGLSYTTFEYAGLSVTPQAGGGRFRVRVTVVNTGERAGREVVQVYSRGPRESRVSRPVRELRGFTAVDLAAGESREVLLELDRADLAYFSEREGGWRVEGGTYRIEVGASSRDIRCSVALPVEGDPSRIRLTGRNTLAEWLAHPVGGPLLLDTFASRRDPQAGAGALTDPVMRRFLAGMPLDVISEFPQSPVSPKDVEDLAERAAAAATRDARATEPEPEGEAEPEAQAEREAQAD